MKNGTYNYVICSSQCGVDLRIAIWCKTPWSKSQHMTPYCNLHTQILSWSTHNPTLHSGHLNLILVCFVQNTH